MEWWDNADGTADLVLRALPEDEVHACFNRINAAAQALKADGDERGIDAIRADLTTALLRGHLLPDLARPFFAIYPAPGGTSPHDYDVADHTGPAGAGAGAGAGGAPREMALPVAADRVTPRPE